MLRWWYFPMMGNWSAVTLIPLFMLGIVLYGVIRIYKDNNDAAKERMLHDSIRLLDESYARGEMSVEEYKKEKEMLMNRKLR